MISNWGTPEKQEKKEFSSLSSQMQKHEIWELNGNVNKVKTEILKQNNYAAN